MGFPVSAKERTRRLSDFKQKKEIADFLISAKEGSLEAFRFLKKGTSGLSYSNLQVSPW
jgi:hypothetical protein